MSEPTRQETVNAAMAFGFMAASFVCEPETWPVFATWAAGRGGLWPEFTREHAELLRDELMTGMRVTALLGAGSARQP